MSGLILPESLKAEKEINKINIERYKGFLTSVVKIENNYTNKKSLVTMFKSAETDDIAVKKFTEKYKYYAFAENKDGISLQAMGPTRNEAGQKLHKLIDLIIKAKYGQ